MFKVEYLLLLEEEKSKCKTVKALKSLLESDSDIEIEKDTISYKGYKCNISIKLGKNTSEKNVFFNISLTCISENDIVNFSSLLKAVRGAINLVSKTNYVIWDDLSLFYAQQAYPMIFDIENVMRKLITKFMITNVGIGWTKDRVPTDVQQSVNQSNKDSNYLNNVDFIQLKNFLFSENYPAHKDNVLKKLKDATDISTLKLEEIKSLLPESNWSRYFEPLVGCQADYLKSKWDKLYELRCNVAHNKSFTKQHLKEVIELVKELKPHLEKALSSLDKIVIEENDKESVAENIVMSFNEKFGSFILTFRQLEEITDYIWIKINDKRKKFGIPSINMQLRFLLEEKIITTEIYSELIHINNIRNSIIHNTAFSITIPELEFYENMLEEIILQIKDYLSNNNI